MTDAITMPAPTTADPSAARDFFLEMAQRIERYFADQPDKERLWTLHEQHPHVLLHEAHNHLLGAAGNIASAQWERDIALRNLAERHEDWRETNERRIQAGATAAALRQERDDLARECERLRVERNAAWEKLGWPHGIAATSTQEARHAD